MWCKWAAAAWHVELRAAVWTGHGELFSSVVCVARLRAGLCVQENSPSGLEGETWRLREGPLPRGGHGSFCCVVPKRRE